MEESKQHTRTAGAKRVLAHWTIARQFARTLRYLRSFDGDALMLTSA